MLEDLIHETNPDNAPGIAPVIYAIEKDDIATWPAMTATPTTNAQKSTRSGSTFTCKTGKKFEKIELTANTGELEIKTSGGPRQNSPMSTFKCKRAGLSAAAIGWLKQNKNKELVLVVPDRNGLQVILGDEVQGAFLTEGSSKTGVKSGDERGLDFNFTYEGFEPTVWAGTPPLTPAS